MKKILLLLSILLFWKEVEAQCSELEIINQKKIAIVFGEQDYKYVGPLANPLNDAKDVSDSLKRLGFSVYTYYNADKKTMTTAIEEWYTKISNFDVALFYYSGHGAEVNGDNFLFPVDANPQGISDLYYAAYPANRILTNMEIANSKVNIMILDACRNNPFRSSTRDIKNGLAPMTGRGSFIGFAASPGTVANDGDKRNGFYTEAILQYIAIPNLTIDQIFTKVNQYVRSRSNNKQIPYKNSSLSSDFCFNVKGEKTSLTRSTVIQQSSGILLSSTEDKIYTSDSSNSSLVVKDSKTLKDLSIFGKDKIHSYKILSKGKENCYVIDTTSSKLFIINRENIKSELQLKNKPFEIIVSNDEKKAYITSQPSSTDTDISIIDINENKLVKHITANHPIQGLALSNNGKFVYAISRCNKIEGYISIIDIKLDKVVKTVRESICGDAIALSPDGKNLYASSVGEGNVNQINIIDINTLKSIRKLDFQPRAFSFTLDNKYTFALGKSEIAVIRNDDNEIVSKLPFATSPGGIALSDDGRVFVWLPKENRTAVLSLSESVQNTIPVDPETKLKIFKEEYTKKVAASEQYKLVENIEILYNLFFGVIGDLSTELGPTYESAYNGESVKRDYKEGTLTFNYGFRFKGDDTKRLVPNIIAKFTENFLILSTKINNKEDVYRVSSTGIEWNKIRSYIRFLYLNNLDQLK